MFYIRITVLFILIYLLSGCSATPVENRYKKKTDSKDIVSETPKDRNYEEFNLSSYKTVLPLSSERKEFNPSIKESKYVIKNDDIWYDYDTSGTELRKSKSQGYRIQLLATDNLTEAEEIRAELYFKTIARAIYIDFDTPFYKVKVGDFIHREDAQEYSFKLLQMGFSNTTIVKDSVIVFK